MVEASPPQLFMVMSMFFFFFFFLLNGTACLKLLFLFLLCLSSGRSINHIAAKKQLVYKRKKKNKIENAFADVSVRSCRKTDVIRKHVSARGRPAALSSRATRCCTTLFGGVGAVEDPVVLAVLYTTSSRHGISHVFVAAVFPVTKAQDGSS